MNSVNIIIFGNEISFYLNYLVLFLAVLYLISVIGSIKKNKKFMKMTLLFVLVEFIYIICVLMYVIIKKWTIGVAIILVIYLLINLYIMKYIKRNWLSNNF
ncbi:hypothetical protein [Thermohalobacter berrensis]|uniref:Uncharacterized protein n=1 Tax=Thermohalobacter berrensis TaxID=99594 RepID=A0A419T772_9FIRM|nr:hypothetical protein [Thermohalobacter berrensis]RKD33437.1 hypothetical protein BET03_09290 [Thermohalobacter berrensis]